MTEDVLTFEELRRAQTRERDTDTLQELEDGFFDRARNYLEMKRDPDSHLENREYRNARNILEDLLDMRQKKIVRLAFLAVKSDVKVEHLMTREEDLFDAVREDIGAYRGDLHDDLFTVPPEEDAPDDSETGAVTGQEADEPADTAQQQEGAGSEQQEDDDTLERDVQGGAEKPDEPDEAGESGDTDEQESDETQIFGGDTGDADEDDEEDDGADAAEPAADDAGNKDGADELETVVFTQDVAEFMGVDLTAYGPYEEGDEAELPAKNAQVLVDQDKAERR